ncbi:Sec14p-like phosphatidylinositol transfer family protein [Actinidia rufa]|uniref:Sec14p-like phosphatidylinositol transfer family protein n=1 Tax=Actinidia rufa TaxID=165716 RepID=A0A7J0HB35_9ERIC|nr:Sec14p-like phosphatidylinositol transfer family protein [Actinidia rufa]
MPDEKVFPSPSVVDDGGSVLSFQDSPKKDFDPDPNFREPENPDSTEKKTSRKKELLEFRCRVEDAILCGYILGKSKGKFNSNSLREISLWGVPLLPSNNHQGTDVVLMKFLKAKDFKVAEAFNMLLRTLKWRREFGVEGICDEEFDSRFEELGCIDGKDRLGRPVWYSVLGGFKNREMCKNAFGTEAKCEEFVRWKVQTMENGVGKLGFKPGEVDSILQIIDLKNSPSVKELRSLNKKIGPIFQENYPEIITRNIYINVPFWYYVRYALQSQSKSKFVFARPPRVTQTLLKYISPENLPVQYGGLKRENDNEFSPDDKALILSVGSGTRQSLQIPAVEAGVTVVWDATVVGFDVSYKEEFIPDDDCSYNVLLQNERKMKESARNSFYIYEPGRIVITIDNATSKNKKIFFRNKSKPTLPVYVSK